MQSAPRIFTPDYYARLRDLESRSWWNAAMRDVAGSWIASLPLATSGRLLDVGCGSGQTMAWFAGGHPGWSTAGTDVALDAVHAANDLRRGQIARASALALPFASTSIDLLISIDVLQHLPLGGGDEQALREMHRVLKPGGFLFVRTNAQVLTRVADDREADFHRYDAAELRAKFANAAFRIRRLVRVNALLGLAELPRDLRARGRSHSTYHGLSAQVRRDPAWVFKAKRRWLRFEAWMALRGLRLPLGRTHLILAERPR